MRRGKIPLAINGFVLVLIGLISLPFFGIGAWELWGVWQDAQTFETVEGEVIHNTMITSQDTQDPTIESSTYHPVVTFKTMEGETKTFTSSGGSYPAKYEIGKIVTVMYDPTDPSDAQIQSWEIWFVPILFTAIGCIPILIVVGILLVINVLVNRKVKQTGNG